MNCLIILLKLNRQTPECNSLSCACMGANPGGGGGGTYQMSPPPPPRFGGRMNFGRYNVVFCLFFFSLFSLFPFFFSFDADGAPEKKSVGVPPAHQLFWDLCPCVLVVGCMCLRVFVCLSVNGVFFFCFSVVIGLTWCMMHLFFGGGGQSVQIPYECINWNHYAQ